MMYKTHLVFGIFLFLLIYAFFQVTSPIIFFVFLLFGSLFPDLDAHDSKLGSKIFPISLFLKHRGMFHTVFLLLLFSSLIYFIFPTKMFYLAFGIGFLSHLILDALNYAGIRPFYPIHHFEVKGFVKIHSFGEYVLFFSLIVFIAAGFVVFIL